ncbi:MAG: hypothetical protein H0W61_01045 [Bacteroidetes bacterium]|nr:hypothetical protein [Bacteroidota bacterium]
MKRLFLSLLLISASTYVKSQSVIIYVTEKIKSAEIPVVRTDFEVAINDSIKKKLTSQNDGSLPRISLEKGKYKIMVSGNEFMDAVEKDVVVNESRTTELTVFINRKPQQPAETKKTKK